MSRYFPFFRLDHFVRLCFCFNIVHNFVNECCFVLPLYNCLPSIQFCSDMFLVLYNSHSACYNRECKLLLMKSDLIKLINKFFCFSSSSSIYLVHIKTHDILGDSGILKVECMFLACNLAELDNLDKFYRPIQFDTAFIWKFIFQ